VVNFKFINRLRQKSKEISRLRQKINLFSFSFLKLCALLVFLLAFHLFLGVAALTFAADDLIQFLPSEGSYLRTQTPEIVVKSKSRLLRLFRARLTIDGDDVSEALEIKQGQIYYRPKQAMTEGRHIVEGTFIYGVLFGHLVKLKWQFNIDVTPPQIKLYGYNNQIVINTDEIALRGSFESGGQLSIFLSGQPVPYQKIGDRKFVVLLRPKTVREKLTLKAIDRAGNTSERSVELIIDKQPPRIKEIVQGRKRVIRGRTFKVKAIVSDKETTVTASTLIIDDKFSVVKEPKNGIASFKISGIPDGRHLARLEVIDAAGNKSIEEWRFRLDSTEIMIDRRKRLLLLYKGGKVAKVYRVAVGMSKYPTPRGHFRIVGKRKNPTWHNPGTEWAKDMPKFIPPGPGNPLGTRALNLSAPGIRIHGTYNTGSIGRAASHGCVRMFIKDAEELYKLVSIGTPVHIY
jgi:lipoprotein-anchoring transpeptidase ErfK/SrfK